MLKMKMQASLLRCVMQWPVESHSASLRPGLSSFRVHFHPEFIFSAQQSEKQEAF